MISLSFAALGLGYAFYTWGDKDPTVTVLRRLNMFCGFLNLAAYFYCT